MVKRLKLSFGLPRLVKCLCQHSSRLPAWLQICATGKMGFIRNLTEEEIIDQIIYWNHKLYPKYVGRIAFMGMGEPFLNWDNLIVALNLIRSKMG